MQMPQRQPVQQASKQKKAMAKKLGLHEDKEPKIRTSRKTSGRAAHIRAGKFFRGRLWLQLHGIVIIP